MTDDEFIIKLQHLRLDKPKGHDLSIAYAIAMHFYGSVEEMAKHYINKAHTRIGEDVLKGKRTAGLKPQ
jgi:hypothetical protein